MNKVKMQQSLKNAPFATKDFSALIREGGKIVGSGRVATIIE